jgi:WD40 repeat protein
MDDHLYSWIDARLSDKDVESGATKCSSEEEAEFMESLSRADTCARLLDRAWPQKKQQSDDRATTESTTTEHDNRCGRFEILDLIGRGGMGNVFRAHDPAIGRDVALKIPHPGLLLDPQARERFAREARAAGILRHPNIVRVLESGDEGSVCYIVLEYCDGPTLADWLVGRSDPVPIQSAVRMVIALAEAVQHAHDRGVLHRDLKPSNVLLDAKQTMPSSAVIQADPPGDNVASQDSIPFPRITDFGLARIITVDSSVTQTGSAIGTAQFMSPEQSRGGIDEVGPASDQFSLGVILYQMLTGTNPFHRGSVVKTLAAVQQADPLAPSRQRRGIAADLDAICLKSLRKNPDERYRTVGEFADDLQRFLDGAPVKARPVDRFKRATKWCRRHPAITAVLAIFLLATATVTLLAIRLAAANDHLATALVEARMEKIHADSARDEANEANEAAAADAEKLRLELYSRDMQIAFDAHTDGWPTEVKHLLDKQVPATSESDHRDGAWTLLHKIYNRSPAAELLGHEGPVNEMAVFADGTRLATVGDDATIRIWNLDTNVEEFVLRDERREYVPRFLTGKLTRDLNESIDQPRLPISDAGRGYQSLAVSPDGQTLATGNLVLSLWDLQQRKRLRDLVQFPTRILGVAFSPDGSLIAAQSADHGVCIVSPTEGLLHQFATDHGSNRLMFSSDGSLLAAPFKSEKAVGLRIWDTVTWDHQDCVYPNKLRTFALSNDNRLALVGCFGGFVGLAKVGSGRWNANVTYRCGVSDVAFSPDERSIAACFDDGALMIMRPDGGLTNTSRGKLRAGLQSIPAHIGGVNAVRYVNDEKVATGGNDGAVRLWDLSQSPISPRIADRDFAGPIEFVPGRPDEFIASTHTGFKRYDFRTGTMIQEASFFDPKNEAEATYSIGIDAKGRFAAFAGGTDGELVVWDFESEREVFRTTQAKRITEIELSPDGLWMAHCGTDHTVRVTSVNDWKEVHRIDTKGHGRAAAFAPDSRRLIYADSEGALVLLNVPTWSEVARKQLVSPVSESATRFTPDGHTIVSGHSDSVIRLWAANSLDDAGELVGQAGFSRNLAVYPDGKILASTCGDWKIRFWHLPTQNQIGILTAGYHVAFSQQGLVAVAKGGLASKSVSVQVLGLTARQSKHASIASE